MGPTGVPLKSSVNEPPVMVPLKLMVWTASVAVVADPGVVVTMLIVGLSPVRLLLATVSVGWTLAPRPFWNVTVVVGTPRRWTGPVHCDEPLTTRRAPY